MASRPLNLAILAFASLTGAMSLGQSRTVALTFDDLPMAGVADPAEAERINRAILNALAKHHAPAIAFVNEKSVQAIGDVRGKQILGNWVKQGHDLGNHTLSHLDLNDLTVEQFKREVILGEASFVPLLAKAGRTPRFLRFPYNHTGDTKEKHDAVAAFLAEDGYKVAPCTIDNEDYEFARAYDLMLQAGDQDSAKKVRSEYLAYTATEVDYYSRLHQQVFGREIPHVMLLHANRLNGDVIEKVLQIFEDRHYKFVPLEVALSDAAYQIPDTLASKYGQMWGYRWATELGIKVNGSLETEPSPWVLKYGKSSAK